MLVKLSPKNQITVPRKILDQLPDARYFEAELKDGVVILKPVQVVETNLEQIREKMRKLELDEGTVAEAVRWARSKQ